MKYLEAMLFSIILLLIALLGYRFLYDKEIPLDSDSQDLIRMSSLQVITYRESSEAYGSAVIIDENDLHYIAITNHHVIQDALSIRVIDYLSNTHEASLLPGSPMASYDLALITFNKTLDLYVIPMGESYQDNEEIISAGYPGGAFSYTMGRITRTLAIEHEVSFPVIHHTSFIDHGSSGGALLNAHGELIGINFAKYMHEDQFIKAYAIPVAMVKEYLGVIAYDL